MKRAKKLQTCVKWVNYKPLRSNFGFLFIFHTDSIPPQPPKKLGWWVCAAVPCSPFVLYSCLLRSCLYYYTFPIDVDPSSHRFRPHFHLPVFSGYNLSLNWCLSILETLSLNPFLFNFFKWGLFFFYALEGTAWELGNRRPEFKSYFAQVNSQSPFPYL